MLKNCRHSPIATYHSHSCKFSRYILGLCGATLWPLYLPSLHSNGISDDGAQDIGEALKVNQSLRKLEWVESCLFLYWASWHQTSTIHVAYPRFPSFLMWCTHPFLSSTLPGSHPKNETTCRDGNPKKQPNKSLHRDAFMDYHPYIFGHLISNNVSWNVLCGVTKWKLWCGVFVLKCFCISSQLQLDYFKVCSWLKVVFQSVEMVDIITGGGNCLK